jgi:hypothetical protein
LTTGATLTNTIRHWYLGDKKATSYCSYLNIVRLVNLLKTIITLL